jgi:hypothetical protein
MTLHFHWLHAPRWMAHAHFSRAMTLVLGVIGVSLLFSALRVLDVAISGELVAPHPVASAPARAASALPADLVIPSEPIGAGNVPVDDTTVVPAAAAEALSL